VPGKKPRLKIKQKWVQGGQLVINVHLVYNAVELDRQASCPLEMVSNPEQFKAFLEEVYEANKPKVVDLTTISEVLE